MNNKIHEYLLKKYAIPNMGNASKFGGVLSSILYKLNKTKKLDDIDKIWFKNKEMYKFLEFIEDWEKTGKPNYYMLHESYDFPYKDYISPVPIFKREITKPAYLYSDDPQKSSIFELSKPDDEITVIESKNDRNKNTSLSINTGERNNNSKRNKRSEKRKEKSIVDISTNMGKAHMPLQYKKTKLIEHIKSNIEVITPSTIPKDISSLFLDKIWETINKDIQKDITELFSAYSCNLWTASSVMAYRIFENILKVHIEHDLEEDPAKDITDAISILKDHEYEANLLNKLSQLKEERNSFMHGNTRASPQNAKKSIVDVLSLTMNIHNIKP